MNANGADLPELASLRQVMLWVGLNLQPQEFRLEELDGYPDLLNARQGVRVLNDSQHLLMEHAKFKIARCLIKGRLIALGRQAFYDPSGLNSGSIVYEALAFSRPIVEIPSKHWEPNGIDFVLDTLRLYGPPTAGKLYGYVDIHLRTRDVQHLMRSGPLDVHRPTEAAKPGRKAVHDERVLLRALVWEANVNGLPERQSQIVAKAAELLSVMRPDDPVPGDSWLKEKIARLQETRREYEDARQSIEDKID